MERMRITKSTLATYILFLVWFILIILNLKDTDSVIFLCIWGILISIGIVYISCIRSKLELGLSKIQFWWLIFVVYSFIVSFINQKLGSNYINLSRYIVSFFIAFLALYIFTRFCNSLKFIEIYRDFFAFCSILGIIEIITKRSLFVNWMTSSNSIELFNTFGFNSGLYRVTLFFYHPIYYGILLTIFLIFIMLKPYKSKVLQYLFVFLGIINLIYTQSRSSWIALVCCLLFLLLRNFKQVNKIQINLLIRSFYFIIGIILTLFIVINLFPQLTSNLLNIFSSRIGEVTNNTTNARTANWALVQYSNTIFLKLFGGGDGFATTMLHLHPQFMGWTQAVDNQYLTFYMDYGILGIALFLMFILNIFKTFMSTEDRSKLVISLAIMAIFISAFFYEVYFQNEVNNLLFILICLLNSNSGKVFK